MRSFETNRNPASTMCTAAVDFPAPGGPARTTVRPRRAPPRQERCTDGSTTRDPPKCRDRWSGLAAGRPRTRARARAWSGTARSGTPGSSARGDLTKATQSNLRQHRGRVDAAAVQEPAKTAERTHLEDQEPAGRILDEIDAREDEAEVLRGADREADRLGGRLGLLVSPAGEDRGHPRVLTCHPPIGPGLTAVEIPSAQDAPRITY